MHLDVESQDFDHTCALFHQRIVFWCKVFVAFQGTKIEDKAVRNPDTFLILKTGWQSTIYFYNFDFCCLYSLQKC